MADMSSPLRTITPVNSNEQREELSNFPCLASHNIMLFCFFVLQRVAQDV